jgi:hypothetical protein
MAENQAEKKNGYQSTDTDACVRQAVQCSDKHKKPLNKMICLEYSITSGFIQRNRAHTEPGRKGYFLLKTLA